ncbi:helix-turn-helix transcriptional regulator [Kineosporia babensis]
MEAGKGPYKYADIRALCFMYGADEATTDRLTELAGMTDQDHIWEEFSDLPAPGLGLYLDLEQSAAALHTYDAEMIHGLLRTPAYHDHLTLGEGLEATDRKQAAALRRARVESAFGGRSPLPVAAVIGESALHRIVGSAGVMSEQLRHLRDLTKERENVEVRVLPWSAGAHPGLRSGAFTLLEFPDPDTDVVYLESQTDARYLEKESKLRAYRNVWATLRRLSVPFEEYPV